MASHFRTLLVMLTKWTRQPWTSSFNHHTLALQSAFDSPYSGIHNIASIDLLCQFQNTVSGIYSKHSVPGSRMLRMKCNDSMIIFLVSQLAHNSKEKGELHWWQWNKKIKYRYQCLDTEGETGIGAAYEFSCTLLVKFLTLGMGEPFKMWQNIPLSA